MYINKPTKYQFNEMIERLNKAVEFYKNTRYKFNEIKMFLSSGKKIEFSFRKDNIPHLLGINTFNLKNRGILEASKSFDMLEEVINRSNYIYEKIEKGEINFFEIFSEYIEEKIDSFETILKFDLRDIHFACEYVKLRACINGEADNYMCDYYIALKNENDQYVFLGLKKYEDSKYYGPSSVLACFIKEKSETILKNLISNQMITLVNYVEFTNNGFNRYLRVPDKLLLLKELLDLDEMYGSISNTTKDHLYSLNKNANIYDEKVNSENLINSLIYSISQGKPVGGKALDKAKQLDDDLYFRLIEAYNISLKCSTRTNISAEIEELSILKQQLIDANARIKEQENLLLTKSEIIRDNEEKLNLQEEELTRLREYERESIQLVKKFCKN